MHWRAAGTQGITTSGDSRSGSGRCRDWKWVWRIVEFHAINIGGAKIYIILETYGNEGGRS